MHAQGKSFVDLSQEVRHGVAGKRGKCEGRLIRNIFFRSDDGGGYCMRLSLSFALLTSFCSDFIQSLQTSQELKAGSRKRDRVVHFPAC